jgi:hypothetical protein
LHQKEEQNEFYAPHYPRPLAPVNIDFRTYP